MSTVPHPLHSCASTLRPASRSRIMWSMARKGVTRCALQRESTSVIKDTNPLHLCQSTPGLYFWSNLSSRSS